MHVNVGNNKGFLRVRAELEVHLEDLGWPTLVALTETLLDNTTEHVELTGYQLVARLDRRDGRKGGGVALFSLRGNLCSVNHLADSPTHERCWSLVHTNHGPLLFCVWYRPGNNPAGETSSIRTLEEEWLQHRDSALGTVMVGDMNCHHKEWLRHSSHTGPEGRALFQFCAAQGFDERVRTPTRGDHLLDLVLTDLEDSVHCEVSAKLVDHALVKGTVHFGLPTTTVTDRECWLFRKADWKELNAYFAKVNWETVLTGTADDAASAFTDFVLQAARRFIPVETLPLKKSTHPWLTDSCKHLVRAKQAAEGTADYDAKAAECSAGLLHEYNKYVQRTYEKLRKLPRSSKQWWRLSRELAQRTQKASYTPPLKEADGTWVRDAQGKAKLFANTFAAKCVLPPPAVNEYSSLPAPQEPHTDFFAVRTRNVRKALQALNEDKSTGPDRLAGKLLKRCAETLALPVAKLARRVLHEGAWPKLWKEHWLFPLHKKRSTFDPNNYRGIHLTSLLSKVVERVLGEGFLGFLENSGAFGENQFAYRKRRGYKDLLALNVMTWLWALHHGGRVGVYCSDVSGAFDKVELERLVAKLRNKGLCGNFLRVLESWLGERTAQVVVEGQSSTKTTLRNQVFQGTTWGPPLWNCYYEDSRNAVLRAGFTDSTFADDLNCYRVYAAGTRNETVLEDLEDCQLQVHRWGAANRVGFDASKESLHVLHRTEPTGVHFKILGVLFDTKLHMGCAVHELAVRAGWKLKTLLQTRRYYSAADLVRQYKSHVLSFLESGTPALFHASKSVLEPLDNVQARFLRQTGFTEEEVLCDHNLAPLSARRDMAMLGLIHRTTLNSGPPHFRRWFVPLEPRATGHSTRRQTRLHNRQLHDPADGSHSELLRRSVFGLVRVYNELPQETVDKGTVKTFQQSLQNALKDAARQGSENWQLTYDTGYCRRPRRAY